MGNRPSRNVDFKVTVKTGDLKGAGTNANVKLRMYDDSGLASSDKPLDCRWHDDFEKGSTDVFPVSDDNKALSRITKIELWRDDSGIGSSWYCEWVKITHVRNKTATDSTFPVHRWIGERPFAIVEYDCVLPQDDRSRGPQREAEIAEKKKAYQLVAKAPGMPPQVRIGS